jgi:hypothetical protein
LIWTIADAAQTVKQIKRETKKTKRENNKWIGKRKWKQIKKWTEKDHFKSGRDWEAEKGKVIFENGKNSHLDIVGAIQYILYPYFKNKL